MTLAAPILCGALTAGSAESSPNITKVYHSPSVVDGAAEEGVEEGVEKGVAVSFRLSDAARVELTIYDGRDRRVQAIESNGVLQAGDHELRWDARDFAGRRVPEEAYVYTLTARAGREEVVWDPSDLTGGGDTAVRDIAWNPQTHRVRYRLSRPARVRLRARLGEDGPEIATLIDFVARSAGAHSEPWPGWDEDEATAMLVARNPDVTFSASAFELSANTILIGRSPPRVELIRDLPSRASVRPATSRASRSVSAYHRRPIEQRRDLPAEVRIEEAGDGALDVRPVLEPGDALQLNNDRFHAVFFLDGERVFEEETAFYPMTWRIDSGTLEPGVHVVTVNLRSYEGHVGIGTARFRVAAPKTGLDEAATALPSQSEPRRIQ